MTANTVILASNSPRRRELLDAAGIGYVADPASVDETALPGEMPADYVKRLALAKARETARRHGCGLVVGADTVVVAGGEILGKPEDEGDAARMLGMLSGRTHVVMTGVAVVDAATGESVAAVESTEVRIKHLSRERIAEYVATGEPLDKAGGYGIQGRAALFVEGITGCYTNVVGLPLARLADMLDELRERPGPCRPPDRKDKAG